ncbi:hypothetical protein QDA01_gp64 [Microbacterium phage Cinna]|uniref:Uncharacterized protein n=2 Tax=Mementomorivirus TaxID=2733194 RepID=A0A2Z4Q5G9_9CAUD|nr:hypothetical protein HOT41_gp67 [Microbacterium phage MementoMori]YP_010751048.1 hypothetical protein QDA01_gp64 [Microbacterium phage Cinna]AWY05296.1 hypothetical protein SEA_MEMENTOMORI_42 [Microbacterium phage MementoMori]QDH91625.1 hypothetical protein PBI_CINNA_41 [Microbacterium phage Cinna]
MTAAMVLAADAAGSEGIPWLGPAIAVVTVLLGGGGLAALFRLRHDKRIGIAQQETAEDDALSNRWKAIIEAQTASLLEPMTRRLATLETTVGRLETELTDSRKKYWSAIGYIRSLNTWIARHLPESVEQVPTPPAVLAEDI